MTVGKVLIIPKNTLMPQTLEAYKRLADRDLELIMEQKEEISRLKQDNNKLLQKLNSFKKGVWPA